MKELSPKYNPAEAEAGRYQNGLMPMFSSLQAIKKLALFNRRPTTKRDCKLHLGHAWDTTCRISSSVKTHARFDTLWLPGMDHAGISRDSQAKVEERLRGEGI